MKRNGPIEITLAAALLLVAASACVPVRRPPGAAPGASISPEDRARSARNLAAAKHVSQATQSAVATSALANSLCYGRGPDFVAAHKGYREALALEPTNTYILVAQATCYARQGLETKFSGSDGQATTSRDALRLAGRWFRRALALARQALRVNQSYGTAHLLIAEVQALQGYYPKAIATLDRIEELKLIPGGLESAFYAWRAFAKRMNGQPATEDAEKAQELGDPIEFAEFVDRLMNPDGHDRLFDDALPVAPVR